MISKMKCREIFEKISEFIDKDLDPKLCDQIEEHIKGCVPCVAFINTLRKTVELYSAETKTGHEIPRKVSANLMEFLKKELEPNAK